MNSLWTPGHNVFGRRYRNPDPKPENPEKLFFLSVWALSGTIEPIPNKGMTFQVTRALWIFLKTFNTLEKFKFNNKKALTWAKDTKEGGKNSYVAKDGEMNVRAF